MVRHCDSPGCTKSRKATIMRHCNSPGCSRGEVSRFNSNGTVRRVDAGRQTFNSNGTVRVTDGFSVTQSSSPPDVYRPDMVNGIATSARPFSSVLFMKTVQDKVVVLAHFQGVEKFNGLKLLVYKKIDWDRIDVGTIDPHFYPECPSPLIRVTPDKEGVKILSSMLGDPLTGLVNRCYKK